MLRPRLDGNIQFQMMCEMYGEPERGGVHDFGSHRLVIGRARPVRAKIRHHVARIDSGTPYSRTPIFEFPSLRETVFQTGKTVKTLSFAVCSTDCRNPSSIRSGTMLGESLSDTH